VHEPRCSGRAAAPYKRSGRVRFPSGSLLYRWSTTIRFDLVALIRRPR